MGAVEQKGGVTRRAALGAGAGLWLGFAFGCNDKTGEPRKPTTTPPVKGPPEVEGAAKALKPGELVELNAWIHIDSSGGITLMIPESEMGQGTLTGLSQVLADELEADWKTIRAVHAPVRPDAFGRQGTGGSTSLRHGYEPTRKVGAAARQMLQEAAAQTWGVPVEGCEAVMGQVKHAESGRTLGYGALVAAAAKLKVPTDPPLKTSDQFRYIGKPMGRLDLPEKVTGAAVYGLDVRQEGMRIAVIARNPDLGGKPMPASMDREAAKAVPGVEQVVDVPDVGVAVVAQHTWAAIQGRRALAAKWSDREGALSSKAMVARLTEALPKGAEARKVGDPETALSMLSPKGKRLEAIYSVPYLAHVSMEPMNCAADVRADRCTVWAPTQSPTRVQQAAMEITGLGADQVEVITTMMGGGFGRRSVGDFAPEAITLSKLIGQPVKVMWTREDDTRGGHYRPAAVNRFEGALDGEGWPEIWTHQIASPSILAQMRPLGGAPDRTSIEGAANLPYALPHLRVTAAHPELEVSTWFWRSVGSSQNAYVTECFFDELCRLGGQDPVEARRRLLSEHPRHKRALDLAAARAKWGQPLPEGHAHGVAVHESFGSVVAQVAEVSVETGADGKKRPRVHKITCVVDCGVAVNPDAIKAQMEGGIAYGLSAALHGEVTFTDGKADQSNFHNSPIVRMGEMPEVVTHIIAEGDPIGGIGEPGTPPVAPAVCNALLALTGQPVRSLPIRLG